jgi:hypothetical protein
VCCELKNVENLCYILSDSRMTEKQKNDLPGGAEENHKKTSVRMAGGLAEILTGHPSEYKHTVLPLNHQVQ